VLRHQLRVLTRGGKRPRYTSVDRAFLAAVSRFLPKERWFRLRGRARDDQALAPPARGQERVEGTARPGASTDRSGPAPADPSPGKGEPPVGLPKDQGRAPQARHHRIGHDHRQRAAPGRPGAGASADRTDVGRVPAGPGPRLASHLFLGLRPRGSGLARVGSWACGPRCSRTAPARPSASPQRGSDHPGPDR
jgi:hypothetical protein